MSSKSLTDPRIMMLVLPSVISTDNSWSYLSRERTPSTFSNRVDEEEPKFGQRSHDQGLHGADTAKNQIQTEPNFC
ncbi:hypothetical protein I7I50_01227 [Histoplasma capsulatum G186AR]|uniref:Uncharacterized protein n=1 Tax=Ajellomyces capsulatus TaxID=5037 RepID=A0A8H7YZ75_AJECA|nr:hypothetical protein I7I52_08946 [Histoplasma capsulatum]QSS73165.1 hypothetical protein I7I50_01227 [Histoplasma capsulatum G186AR]